MQIYASTLLCAAMLQCAQLHAQASAAELPAPEARTPGGTRALLDATGDSLLEAYRREIAELELSGGAYSPALTEPLLELGTALQRAGLHEEAVRVLRRSLHLARINDGLYSQAQLAMLEAEIRSHIALGQFSEADERHRYLYRVQQRTLDSPRRGLALMRQARWQRRAYDLALDEDGFGRLQNMWNLYRMALADLAEHQGEASVQLMAPLYGMLEAQYLLSSHSQDNRPDVYGREAFRNSMEDGRFHAYRSQSYKQGNAVLQAMLDLQRVQPDAGPEGPAHALILQGDWHLWHGKLDEAMETYRAAMEELAALDDAQARTQRLLGTPQPLPALANLRPLPAPLETGDGDLLIEFGVDAFGKVQDLRRLDEQAANDAAANRLLRKLRRTRFRPRFVDGQAVATTEILWRYDTRQW
jgi:hypothetical protein